MHRRSRLAAPFAALSVAVALFAAPGSVAAVNDLTTGIAPGVVRGNDGFGTATVVVPENGYVTYFVSGAPSLAGTPVQIWSTAGGDWHVVASRSFAPDGTLHYFARVSGRTDFQARIPGTPGGVGPARHATTWPSSSDRRTRISVGCADFEEDVFARPNTQSSALVERTVGVKAGTQLDVAVCSNASTGFAWEAAALDSRHLQLLGHRYVNDSDFVGAPGIEIWSFKILAGGSGHAVLAYSQPWSGGTKAAWTFVLTTRS